jgi:hypothetical protein
MDYDAELVLGTIFGPVGLELAVHGRLEDWEGGRNKWTLSSIPKYFSFWCST